MLNKQTHLADRQHKAQCGAVDTWPNGSTTTTHGIDLHAFIREPAAQRCAECDAKALAVFRR